MITLTRERLRQKGIEYTSMAEVISRYKEQKYAHERTWDSNNNAKFSCMWCGTRLYRYYSHDQYQINTYRGVLNPREIAYDPIAYIPSRFKWCNSCCDRMSRDLVKRIDVQKKIIAMDTFFIILRDDRENWGFAESKKIFDKSSDIGKYEALINAITKVCTNDYDYAAPIYPNHPRMMLAGYHDKGTYAKIIKYIRGGGYLTDWKLIRMVVASRYYNVLPGKRVPTPIEKIYETFK